MRVYRTREGAVIEADGTFRFLPCQDFDAFINRDDLHETLARRIDGAPECPRPAKPLAPIGTQELWACGVTYLRSREARMEEAKDAGGGDFYDRVYSADRPEIFFKAPHSRVRGPGQPVRIRGDSTWDVPEPEFTFFLTSGGKIVGYTIGNDMSSRSIEGENPLYLPQAKSYDGSAALGPCLLVPAEPLPPETEIELEIVRDGGAAFTGSAQIANMKRTFEELASWLTRETTFPQGVFVMTGTGIVPPDDFTLKPGDAINITVTAIGTLTNEVET